MGFSPSPNLLVPCKILSPKMATLFSRWQLVLTLPGAGFEPSYEVRPEHPVVGQGTSGTH